MKVFYDDKCSICSREIKFYKKQGVKDIEWIGIHKSRELKNKKKEEYLKIMHVIDDNNKVNTGVDTFIVLWKKHKYFKYLAIIISFYPVKFIISKFYKVFAYYRYKKLYKPH